MGGVGVGGVTVIGGVDGKHSVYIIIIYWTEKRESWSETAFVIA